MIAAAQTVNIYIPSCPKMCSLRPEAIGEETAYRIAAAYQPGISEAPAKRLAERILGRQIARATYHRHVDHLRPSRIVYRPDSYDYDDRGSQPETKELALTDLATLNHETPNAGWDHAYDAVAAAGADWLAVYERELGDLQALDAAEVWAKKTMAL
ncbi:MAG: hypothetical protein HY262_10845 [Chloroflexi bacterium]|nr:hypothetical protein [Chloroflexota bacterium]